MQAVYGSSERRALRAFSWPRSTHRHKSASDPQFALRLRLRELAGIRVAYGYRRLHVLLQREGWQINHKRVYRLYHEEGLIMRKKVPRRRVASVKREIKAAASSRNECWSMDFVSDQLFDDRRLRVLVILENFTRECLALDASSRIHGIAVVTTLERITRIHGFPKRIKVDNGPEFISKDLDRWAYWNKVELDFSRPGRPSDNALVEAFNSRFRQECLNQHWFLSLADANTKLRAWQTNTTQSVHIALWVTALHWNVGQIHPMLKPLQRKSIQKVNLELDPGWGQVH
jgi:putative transposase